jgi:hypothetical protein
MLRLGWITAVVLVGLHPVEAGITPPGGHQICVRPVLCDPAIFKDGHHIGHADCAETVGDEQ